MSSLFWVDWNSFHNAGPQEDLTNFQSQISECRYEGPLSFLDIQDENSTFGSQVGRSPDQKKGG